MTVVLTVENLVNCKRPGLTESFITRSTLVGFVFGVDVLVVSQMILSSECFATNITWEGSLICVGSLVDHDIVGLGELSVTIFTDEPLLGSGGSGRGGVLQSLMIIRMTSSAHSTSQQSVLVSKPVLQEQSLAQTWWECWNWKVEMMWWRC